MMNIYYVEECYEKYSWANFHEVMNKGIKEHGQHVYSGASGWVFTPKKEEEGIQERIVEKPKLYSSS